MTTADTPGDLELGDAVAAEPAWTPSVNAAGTGVAVVDGAVRLSGGVATWPDGSPAEIAAFRVRGVRGVTAIADGIAIRASWDAHPDTGTVEVKGAAWAVFRGSCVRNSTGYSQREWPTSAWTGQSTIWSVPSVSKRPEMAVRLAKVRPEARSSAT